MKTIVLFVISFIAFILAQPPAPYGGPYIESLNFDNELAVLGSLDSIPVYGIQAYYRFYWTVNTTSIKFGVVCRVKYPSTTYNFATNNNTWCGFGFTSEPETMAPTSDPSDAVIGHVESNGQVYVNDFRLGGKNLTRSVVCISSGLPRGVCPDALFTFNGGGNCTENLYDTGGVYTVVSDTEAYLAFTWTRLLNTGDLATCDKQINLGEAMNPIFSIGFTNRTGEEFPFNSGQPGFTNFFHSSRGPISGSGDTITFQLATTTQQVTTLEDTTQDFTTEQATTQGNDSVTTQAFTTRQSTTARSTTARVTGAPVGSASSLVVGSLYLIVTFFMCL